MMTTNEPTRHSFEDLTVWRTFLPGVRQAILPAHSDQPNPKLDGGMVFVSVFSPGCVCALDATSGEICWRHELPHLGNSSLKLAEGTLLSKTAQTLYALELPEDTIGGALPD